MARSLVSHRYWGAPGGGQLVCASAAVALDKMGLTPVLTGTFNFDKAKYLDWYGIDLTKYDVEVLMSLNVKAFGLWTRLYMWKPAERVLKRERDVRIMFIDDETYKPLLKYRQSGLRIVEYIHFPLEVVVDPKYKGTGLAYGEDPYIMERYGKFPMNIYWGIFVKLLPRYLRGNPFESADVVLTNSRWTAEVAKMVYGEAPAVLNPPIPPNAEIVERPKPFEERRPIVVMLGRFSEEKRYHWVVKEVAPRLIREVPGAKLVIFGGATTRTQLGYVERVAQMAREAGLRVEVVQDDVGKAGDSDVYLRLNAPRAEINRVMDSAKAFLHATINEHWGIAVAEAMARGLPVVVHKSGGAWTDLAEEGHAGMGYEDAEEAVEGLAKLLGDKDEWGLFSSRALSRVADIGFNKFISSFLEYIKRIT